MSGAAPSRRCVPPACGCSLPPRLSPAPSGRRSRRQCCGQRRCAVGIAPSTGWDGLPTSRCRASSGLSAGKPAQATRGLSGCAWVGPCRALAVAGPPTERPLHLPEPVVANWVPEPGNPSRRGHPERDDLVHTVVSAIAATTGWGSMVTPVTSSGRWRRSIGTSWRWRSASVRGGQVLLGLEDVGVGAGRVGLATESEQGACGC